MQKLTAPLLRELLIDPINVFETEGTGKSRTQRIVIYYCFIVYVAIPECYSRKITQPIYNKLFQSNTLQSRNRHKKRADTKSARYINKIKMKNKIEYS